MSNKIVIIAAGGRGSRFHSTLPKQYLLLDGYPVIMHTIDAFARIADRIIIVLAEQMKGTWEELCNEHHFKVPYELVIGGETRFQSVRNAIRHITGNSSKPLDNATVIAVHDAARPLVDHHLIQVSFDMALQGKCNVLAVPSTNSIRIGHQSDSRAIDRNTVWQIQTPQTFPAPILIEAFQQEEIPEFTDDASVVERKGHPIHLLESNDRNIKLTFASDFKIAKLYLDETRHFPE
ncbi:2-C-methyl-D-erythritol 4-phosphate cytidylyltransferase [Sphingobacterium faecale]|uniref:2-C-methyl-D-erythritol 4-phosphate cytidylyltransferase n=1 Tax=Sphingobacterium faecale TaxID=2803775 RepID=A0ABS1R030_9SPHI|nr:2-C-methyl-D-erythritol 4-phosphate cytidylyltransferase [Sphingobacterium faecale]MBL1407680.1 2-C-methyl-D-erythritol 4-phosphate cytidylyltransferase [Sphingobacterium faecale]